jgi:hypothetical protein
MVDASNRSPLDVSPSRDLLTATIAGPAGAPVVHSRHGVRFYEDEQRLADVVSAFLAEGLVASARAVVIATGAHSDVFRHRLQARGLDVAGLIAAGTLTLLDAHDTLARFMRDGEPIRGYSN